MRTNDRLMGSPAVWVVTDGNPGNSTQAVGLADAIGWPYEVKELGFTALAYVYGRIPLGATRIGLNRARSAPLAPPWPDLVIGVGRRTAPVVRWIGKQSRKRTCLVQLGRTGGRIAESFDLVVTPAHCPLPSHPRRIEVVVPLNQVTADRLAEAAERWPKLLDNIPHPRVVLLVGGQTSRHCLSAEAARRMGEEVQAFAHDAGGTAFAVTSRRTGAKATEALGSTIGDASHVHRWQPGQRENPYLAYLALADVLVVTGDSESMLGEAAATEKPLYIYPLPERPPSLRQRLLEWVVARAHASPRYSRKPVRPQWSIDYLCAQMVARGIVGPPRDLNELHHALIRRGIARPFGAPMDMPIGNRPTLNETDKVARKVRSLLGFTDH